MPRLPLLCLGVLFSATANAAIPVFPAPNVPIKTEHPYLFASKDDIREWENKLRPVLPDAGSIEIKFTPGFKRQDNPQTDANAAVIFGTPADSVNFFVLQYLDGVEPGKLGFQARFAGPTATEKTQGFFLDPGVASTIVIRFSKTERYIQISRNGVNLERIVADDWEPAKQRFHLVGRKDQVVHELLVKDTAGNVLWDGSKLDWDAAGARYGFMESYAQSVRTQVVACKGKPVNAPNDNRCNVATGSRADVTQTARELGLAYKLTGNTDYVEAAKIYVDHIFKIRTFTPPSDVPGSGLGTNEEWSMSARIAALGVLYDWFGAQLEAPRQAAIRKFIIDTIRTRTGNMDLVSMICGRDTAGKAVGLDASSGKLDCAAKPQIDQFYISGHNASAMHGAALGLLAIVHDTKNDTSHVDVQPMINTLYSHLVDGLLPARSYIGGDGGHQTLFFYNNVGEILDRLVMWQRALAVPDARLEPAFATEAINPYLYGLRGDGTFPTRGDNDNPDPNKKNVSSMALWAATHGKGRATTFYQDHILDKRNRVFPAVWDSILFGVDLAPREELSSLPLQINFQNSGNVLMRDTWDYEKAALLDFKSSSFISQNHQHLDQNSFSLFHKTPLLVDSGIYDPYGTRHWYNYYTRTIAHNSIVVFDPAEKFGTHYESNDGGQWAKEPLYPTLPQIQSGGTHWLEGVKMFGSGERYAYVRANASKAYQPAAGYMSSQAAADKVMGQDGFIRSMLYLRDSNGSADKPPVIVVHDRVRSPKRLPATFLLHAVKKPEIDGTYQTTNNKGRYALPSQQNTPLVVRNGEGVVTVEPILPANPFIKVAGGKDDGSFCPQDDVKVTRDDCRFLVRRPAGTGFEWVNYTPEKEYDSSAMNDVGEWRIEISSVDDTATSAAEYQYFLNVLRVGTEPARPGQLASTFLVSSDRSAHAVELDPQTTVVFGTNSQPATTLRWKPSQNGELGGTIIVANVVADASYSYTYDGTEWILTKDATFNQNHLKASSAGVIEGVLKR